MMRGCDGPRRHHFGYVDLGLYSLELGVACRVAPCQRFAHLGLAR
jgi:hypothetical protein